MFPLGKDNTDYKKISGNFVSSSSINGQDTLIVSSDALTVLAEHAFRDISHLLRPSHLAQLRAILDDKSASKNDHFVAMELLKNANIAAAGVLPMCQDTGTAIIMGKKGKIYSQALMMKKHCRKASIIRTYIIIYAIAN